MALAALLLPVRAGLRSIHLAEPSFPHSAHSAPPLAIPPWTHRIRPGRSLRQHSRPPLSAGRQSTLYLLHLESILRRIRRGPLSHRSHLHCRSGRRPPCHSHQQNGRLPALLLDLHNRNARLTTNDRSAILSGAIRHSATPHRTVAQAQCAR